MRRLLLTTRRPEVPDARHGESFGTPGATLADRVTEPFVRGTALVLCLLVLLKVPSPVVLKGMVCVVTLVVAFSTEPREKRFLACAFAALLMGTLYKYLDRPVLPLLVAALVFLAWAASVAPRALGLACAYACAVVGTLAVGEAWVARVFPFSLIGAHIIEDIRVVDTITGHRLPTESFAVPDAVRGFAGRPDTRVRRRRVVGGRVLVDATYTLDGAGRRVTGAEIKDAEGQVVFLGDSFAFGEAVSDGETTPARVETLAHGRTGTVNLAFKGYGPHQAVATMEQRLDRSAVDRPVRAAIYFALWDVSRAAGRAPWDPVGPRYVVQPSGAVVQDGTFASTREGRILAQLNRSLLFAGFVTPRLRGRGDVDLAVALLVRLDELARRAYGVPLRVVLWGTDDDELFRAGMAQLRRRIPDALTIADLLPPGERDLERLTIPTEGHPTAHAHDVIARAMVERWFVTR